MGNLIEILTPVGRAMFHGDDDGVAIDVDAARPASFVFRSESGIIVWSERTSGCIMLKGVCEARGVLNDSGEPALALSVLSNGKSHVEYLIPAVDVMAMAPMNDGAIACRAALIQSQSSKILH